MPGPFLFLFVSRNWPFAHFYTSRILSSDKKCERQFKGSEIEHSILK